MNEQLRIRMDDKLRQGIAEGWTTGQYKKALGEVIFEERSKYVLEKGLYMGEKT